MENSREISQKIKARSTVWSSYSISGYLPERYENTTSKRDVHLYVNCSIIYISQDTKKPKCPSMDEWIKIFYTHTHTREYYSSIKNENFPFTITGIHIECTDRERKTQCDFIHVES